MFLNTEQYTQDSRRRGHATALLVLVAAFLFSQSLAQAHVHDDGELTATCVVCHHADNSPALLPQAAKALPVDSTAYSTPSWLDVVALPSREQYNYLSRAPPTIQ